MINLKALTAGAKASHLKLLEGRFNAARPKKALAKRAKYPTYIDDLLKYLGDNLTTILTGAPEQLTDVVQAVRTQFVHFHTQAQLNRSSKAWKSNRKDAAAVLLVEKCFDYDTFSKKSGAWGAYQLVQEVGLRICPYCQLHHVNYHMPAGKKTFALRPPLDHFLPKSNYPYLAVSLGNLVPCCGQCNSGVKLSLDPLGKGIRHPRSALPNGRIKFSAQGTIPAKVGGKVADVQLALVPPDVEAQAHIEAFKLEQRYGWYAREIFDLMENYNRFKDYPLSVQKAVWPAELVLGFAPDAAPDRALGLCLLDVFRELESGKVV